MTASASASSPVTLRDVAAAAGVSVSAASMALSDHARISRRTKEVVRATASQLGYVPNSAGRALRAGRAASIAVVVPNTGQHVFGHAYFMHLLVGVTAVANERDTALLVSTSPDETHGVTAYERVLRSGAASGAIVASAAVSDPNVARMVEAPIPVVLVGSYPHLPRAVSVWVEDVAGASAMTRHLLDDHGRRTIGHISGPLDHQTAVDRHTGYRAAMAAVAGALPCLAVGDYSEESGRAAARELLDSVPGLDAIFAANDEMAYGALLELRSRGLSVPGDVALAGYDDFGLARLTTPGLTTVHVPAEQLGRLAADRLFEVMEHGSPSDPVTTLPVRPVLRASCGCADT